MLVHRKRLASVAFACAFLLTACSPHGSPLDPSGNAVYDAVSSIDLTARKNVPLSGAAGDVRTGAAPQGVTYIEPAAGGAAKTNAAPGDASGGAFQVSYEDAPIADVAKSIVVDALGLSLSLDPRVDGRISLLSGRPLTRNQLLTAFENALRASNAALVKDGAGYRVVPAADMGGTAALDTSLRPEPGSGVSVLPLAYISSETVVKLLDGFASKPGSIRFDAKRNLLLIAGTSEERRNTMETALAFDQDWMRGQAVGVYPVASTAPATMILELQRILDAGEGGAYKDLVQFQPIARQNALLVVARTPAALRAASTWIRRLDHGDAVASASHVYKVKYGDARQLATLLQSAMGAGGGRGGAGGLGAADPSAGRLTLASAALGGSANGSTANGSASFANFGTAPTQSPSPFGALQGRPAAAPSEIGGASDPAAASASNGPGGGSGGDTRVRITADTNSNSLLIFADRENWQMIEGVLRQLDRPAIQVSIEATIAEVSLNNGLEYGVQYFLENNRGNFSANLTSQLLSAIPARVLPGANIVLGSGASPRVVLSALSSRTNVKVLSNPSIVVLDNKVGMIQVGDQVPVATTQATLVGTTNSGLNGSAIPVANNIDYRNTGIILRVLPRVTAMGNVTLEIEQEISNVVNNVGQDSLTPTISQRQIRSSVSVTSGQTVVLGGLISSAETGGKTGLPILSSLSFIGDLFAQNKTALNRTELVMFIRPQIIADAVDAQAVAEQMRAKMIYAKPFRP